MRFKYIIISGVVGIGVIGISIRFAIPGRCSKIALTSTTPGFIKNIDPVCDSIIANFSNNIEAGLGLDVSTNQIFWEQNSEKPCFIASITKLMTALIVMEKIYANEISLKDTITATPEASKVGGSRIHIKKGEKFTLEELLKAMIIYSANDASYLTAQYIAGSEGKFVQMMNEKAQNMGFYHTYFSNATGLPPPRKGGEHNISTCVDIAKLALEVIKYPEIRELAATRVDYLRNGAFKLITRNRLLRRYNLVDGLKTGYYREAGWNIVATSFNGTHKVMVIVLGAKSKKAREFIVKRLIKYITAKSPNTIQHS